MTLSSVVLPEPLGPIRPRISPCPNLDVDPRECGDAFEPLRDAVAVQNGDGGCRRPTAARRRRRRPPVALPERGLHRGSSRRTRSSISHRSKHALRPQDQRDDDQQCDRELHRAGDARQLPRADRDALLHPREGVGQERDDRRPRHRARERRPAADHEHREQRERDREVELVRVERDHALGPQRARRSHHRGAQQPAAVSGAHDARADRRRRQRILPRCPQAKARTRFLVETADHQEQHRARRRDAERGPHRDPGEAERPSRVRRGVLEERVHHDQQRQRRHRHRRLGHADDGAAEDGRDDECGERRECDRRHADPSSAVPSADGRSGSCALFTASGIVDECGRVGADAHERHVAERDDAAVADERLDRHDEHHVHEEHHERAARRRRAERSARAPCRRSAAARSTPVPQSAGRSRLAGIGPLIPPPPAAPNSPCGRTYRIATTISSDAACA